MSMAAEQPDDRREDPPCLRTALAMLSQGVRPIPLHPGKKNPIGEGWGLRQHTEASLRSLFWSFPGAGVGILLGDNGTGDGIIDIDIDEPEVAVGPMNRMFPDGLPDTLRFQAVKGMHYALRYDPRLAKYGETIIKGEIGDDGKVRGNPHYLGLEIRIGTIDPTHPVQEQTIIPPTPRADGTARQWIGPGGTLLLPEVAFDDLSRILPIPESVFADLDLYANDAEPEPEPEAEKQVGPRLHSASSTAARAPDPQWDKEEVKAAILPRALDLAREWGLEITGKRATGKGFWECRAIDRKDNDPSAGFHEESGVYTDRKYDQGLSIFQLAVALRVYPDFPNAVNELGKRFGIPPANHAKQAKKGRGDPESNGGYYASDASFAPPFQEEAPVIARHWPNPPKSAAWRGLAGQLAHLVEPHTEADPIGILVQTLVGFGNLIGRHAYFEVGATRHYFNLFCCTAGPTAMGRKGTAWDVVRMALSFCDPNWSLACIKGGLSSGEGLIWEVRDPITKRVPVREKGRIVDYQDEEVDPGIPDKRLMVVETEFGGTLKVLTREGNILSALVRQAWDSGILRTLTKNNPAKATDAHISIVGHITEQEVARYLTENDVANGFANRFLWVAVRQSKILPRGPSIPSHPIRPTLERLNAAAQQAAAEPIRMTRDEAAEEFWDHICKVELAVAKPGLIGAILGRALPQVMRLACLYALMDFATIVSTSHLESALELWRYCERSAQFLFGDSLGDKDADLLLSTLQSTPSGLTQTEITSHVFQRHKSAKQVASILGRLLEQSLIYSILEPTAGRTATRWFAGKAGANKGEKAKEGGGDSESAEPPSGVLLTWLAAFLIHGVCPKDRVIEAAAQMGVSVEDLDQAATALAVERIQSEGSEHWQLSSKQSIT